MMRIIGQKLTDAWGQPCIVESRSGASGAIAAATVSQAPADGYTVLIGYSALLSNTVLMPKPGYRLEDLQPVGMLASRRSRSAFARAWGPRRSSNTWRSPRHGPASSPMAPMVQARVVTSSASCSTWQPASTPCIVPYKGQPPALRTSLADGSTRQWRRSAA